MNFNPIDYGMERRLKELDPGLHARFTDTVFTMQHALFRYQLLFPMFTDHTWLHSLSIIDFCNQLIGPEQLQRLNADEIYVLLMGCYMHDIGMGISQKDFEEFCEEIDFGSYFESHSREDIPRVVRDFHHEFSACYIRKYAEFLEIPSQEHLFAVVQVARGHRRLDLFDEREFPADWTVPNGNTICLPYLAALVRLADEIDVAAARNVQLLYDLESITDELEKYFHRMHQACRRLDITNEAFIMVVQTDEPEIKGALEVLRDKIQATLDLCAGVVRTRTSFNITQKNVEIWEDAGKVDS